MNVKSNSIFCLPRHGTWPGRSLCLIAFRPAPFVAFFFSAKKCDKIWLNSCSLTGGVDRAMPLEPWLKCKVGWINNGLLFGGDQRSNDEWQVYRYISSLIMRLFYVRSSLTHKYIYLHKGDRVYRRIIKTDQQRGKQRVTRSKQGRSFVWNKRLITTKCVRDIQHVHSNMWNTKHNLYINVVLWTTTNKYI